MSPDCAMPDGREPCKGYQIIRAHLDVERESQKKLIAERDKWFNETLRLTDEISRLRAELLRTYSEVSYVVGRREDGHQQEKP